MLTCNIEHKAFSSLAILWAVLLHSVLRLKTLRWLLLHKHLSPADWAAKSADMRNKQCFCRFHCLFPFGKCWDFKYMYILAWQKMKVDWLKFLNKLKKQHSWAAKASKHNTRCYPFLTRLAQPMNPQSRRNWRTWKGHLFSLAKK